MKKTLVSVALMFTLLVGHYLKPAACGIPPAPPKQSNAHVSAPDIFSCEAALRHKYCQPHHWRAMVMHK